MYFKTNFRGNHFIYFWCSPTRAINNDSPGRLFKTPFEVSPENCRSWRRNGNQDMIAPELLTYWSI